MLVLDLWYSLAVGVASMGIAGVKKQKARVGRRAPWLKFFLGFGIYFLLLPE
jgi:hypothetical protein